MRLLVCVLLGLFIQMPPQVFPENRLQSYRQWVGSPQERGILQYTRNCILGALEPERGIPQKAPGLSSLPRTGVYLSLMRDREVRVCMGSFFPHAVSMADTIQDLAQRVTFGDTRTRPLFLSEMEDLSLVLSFVGPLQEIADPYDIDFATQGLYLSQDGKEGVLLPGETRTLSYGIQRLRKQLGIDPQMPCRYATFGVVAFDERSVTRRME